jgi:predicted amidohydrolase YtcJ
LTDQRAELLVLGRVATLGGKSGLGWADAVAVTDGRVIAAGSAADLDGLRGAHTRTLRLAPDQAVMPGITDAHLHLTMLAAARDQLDLSGQPDLAGCLEALAGAHDRMSHDTSAWLVGHGWSPSRLGGWPDTEMLERACPGRAVALWSHDHHSRWVSASALERAGVDEGTPDPEGGLIRRHDDGRPSGILHESAAALVDRVVPGPEPARLEQALMDCAADLAALGVIAVHDPNVLETDDGIGQAQGMYRRMASAGSLPLRVHASIRDHHLGAVIEGRIRSGDGLTADAADDPRAVRLAERYRMGWLKLFSDGALGSRSAALLEPYTDAAERPPTGGPAGMLLYEANELRAILERAAAAGIAGQVHAIGDAAVRLALDCLAHLRRLPLMHRIEHAQLIHRLDVPRFGELGVAASMQPVHLRSDAAIARAAWGGRAENSFPLAGLDRAGAVIPFGTDAPVEPIDPWPGIAVALCRRDPFAPGDAPLGMDQAIDIARAVRAACLDPALVAGETDRGRLVAGHRADLLVVPAAALGHRTEPQQLATIRPLATLIDGEIVYRAPEFGADGAG